MFVLNISQRECREIKTLLVWHSVVTVMSRPYDPISSVTAVLCLCVPSFDINSVQNNNTDHGLKVTIPLCLARVNAEITVFLLT